MDQPPSQVCHSRRSDVGGGVAGVSTAPSAAVPAAAGVMGLSHGCIAAASAAAAAATVAGSSRPPAVTPPRAPPRDGFRSRSAEAPVRTWRWGDAAARQAADGVEFLDGDDYNDLLHSPHRDALETELFSSMSIPGLEPAYWEGGAAGPVPEGEIVVLDLVSWLHGSSFASAGEAGRQGPGGVPLPLVEGSAAPCAGARRPAAAAATPAPGAVWVPGGAGAYSCPQGTQQRGSSAGGQAEEAWEPGAQTCGLFTLMRTATPQAVASALACAGREGYPAIMAAVEPQVGTANATDTLDRATTSSSLLSSLLASRTGAFEVAAGAVTGAASNGSDAGGGGGDGGGAAASPPAAPLPAAEDEGPEQLRDAAAERVQRCDAATSAGAGGSQGGDLQAAEAGDSGSRSRNGASAHQEKGVKTEEEGGEEEKEEENGVEVVHLAQTRQHATLSTSACCCMASYEANSAVSSIRRTWRGAEQLVGTGNISAFLPSEPEVLR
ncbi:hypothetical protein GPECTOR_44g78 [Gonium pectorale]|uniref:Uncharacterized protein n=1 Tax=Gonium pectorale TaxID=33097 RepID=A0A150G9G2_GONPE|nr:hypothetical protein GPECTOR_44g78 [Gonium pectorale]|eukprot:KXZ46403.1 hypothetical protein GPECTOR_44g78 [Gonium pectorale]